MNRLFTLFAALLVGVVASAQDLLDALNANKDYVLSSKISSGYKNELTYNDKGKIETEFEYVDYDESTGQYSKLHKNKYTYDEYGNEKNYSSYEFVDGNWEQDIQLTTENVYDKNGILIEYTSNLYDEGILYEIRNYKLTYDSKGNIIQTIYTNTDALEEYDPYIMTSTYEYNEKNILITAVKEYGTQRFSYNENDRLITITTERNDVVTNIEKITYNEDGTSAIGKNYLADGSTLNPEETDNKYFFIKKTTTPSRRTELDHVGAYNFKTIENGQVVIVKDGEKYDLAGRKL